jgi:hypothetical protein
LPANQQLLQNAMNYRGNDMPTNVSADTVKPGCRVLGAAWPLAFLFAALCLLICSTAEEARAQSPELAMRDLSSGQIKKGSRSIGFGGDGATWGNYALVWKDADTGLVDYSTTQYSNGNDFSFYAVGINTPRLWHDLVIYAIVMSQDTDDVKFSAKSPGLGPAPVPLQGTGVDDALFIKAAMPLWDGVSAGVLFSHEKSHFDATAIGDPSQAVHWQTEWRPSGGFGVAWQPDKTWLFGFRALFNNDFERRIDSVSVSEGMATSAEYRLGASYAPWNGALIDVGATFLGKHNAIAHSESAVLNPNLGFEQWLFDNQFAFRFGLDETSPTAGITYKFAPFRLDVAYVNDMAQARLHNLFGSQSQSVFLALTVDYGAGSSPPHLPMRSSLLHSSDFASAGAP